MSTFGDDWVVYERFLYLTFIEEASEGSLPRSMTLHPYDRDSYIRTESRDTDSHIYQCESNVRFGSKMARILPCIFSQPLDQS